MASLPPSKAISVLGYDQSDDKIARVTGRGVHEVSEARLVEMRLPLDELTQIAVATSPPTALRDNTKAARVLGVDVSHEKAARVLGIAVDDVPAALRRLSAADEFDGCGSESSSSGSLSSRECRSTDSSGFDSELSGSGSKSARRGRSRSSTAGSSSGGTNGDALHRKRRSSNTALIPQPFPEQHKSSSKVLQLLGVDLSHEKAAKVLGLSQAEIEQVVTDQRT